MGIFRYISDIFCLRRPVLYLPGMRLEEQKIYILVSRLYHRIPFPEPEYQKMYLKNHLNAVQPARDLYIHRSTFLYRLKRIKAILESDLTDCDELLYLMISFCLLREEQPKSQEEL